MSREIIRSRFVFEMHSSSKFLYRYTPPTLLTISLFVVYLRTLAPGLTWANDGRDGGDLISAAATGGVAHPTGYPLYLLLARLFQCLPFGSLAFRTNLMSAVFAVLASVLIYQVVTQAAAGRRAAWPVGLVAGYAFGLAPLLWSQAVITEVYTLQAFLTALIVYLYTLPKPDSNAGQRHLDGWRGLVLGLGMGNHLTTILILPTAFILGSIERQTDRPIGPKHLWLRNWKLDTATLLRQLGMFAAGLCLYLIIPLRASANPPINWGNAITPSRFWWLVSGQLYQSYYLGSDLSAAWVHLQAWAGFSLRQFGLLGLILGLAGLILFGKASRLYALTGWIAFISLIFAVFYRSEDAEVYLIPALLSFSIWIGLGLEGFVRQLSARLPIFRLGVALLFVAYFVSRSAANLSGVDASHDQRAESFGREVLAAAPTNALLFAEGDEAVFTLWYFHFALGERSDLTIVAEDLLHFDWYQENLRSTYPGLAIPGPFPWSTTLASANPARGICYVRYSDRTELNCSRPLQAPSD